MAGHVNVVMALVEDFGVDPHYMDEVYNQENMCCSLVSLHYRKHLLQCYWLSIVIMLRFLSCSLKDMAVILIYYGRSVLGDKPSNIICTTMSIH